MKLRWISITAVTLVVASVAIAQPAPRARFVADYLQLTPEQIAAWKQINADTAAALKPLTQNARGLRGQLDAAMSAPSPDVATVGQLALSWHSVREQIRAVRSTARSRRLALLTAEQKTKFESLQAAAGFMRRRGRG